MIFLYPDVFNSRSARIAVFSPKLKERGLGEAKI